MLRVHLARRVCRFYHFKSETYNLPGYREEVDLPEDLRRLRHSITTGEKDNAKLLADIEDIYSPYRDLALPYSATQAEVTRVIELRRTQLQYQIDQVENRKLIEPGDQTDDLPVLTDNQLVQIGTQEKVKISTFQVVLYRHEMMYNFVICGQHTK